LEEEEEPLGMSEEEEEPPVGVEEEKELPPTSPSNHLMKPPPDVREEEWCGGSWSFPPPAYTREEERCGSSWSFPPHGARRSSVTRGRSKPPIAVSDLPLHELRVLANHWWPTVEKTAACTR
jgi:hypothetical protein